MKVSINAIETCISIPECMSTYEIQEALINNEHLQHLQLISLMAGPREK